MTKALTSLIQQATPKQLADGLNWYTQANQFAQQLATDYGHSLDTVCQVIAILSPAVSWDINKRDTESLLDQGANAVVSTYGQNKTKALSVLTGADQINPKALKTYSFYRNLLAPTCDKHVTIDRHAFKAYKKQTKAGSVSITPKQYELARKAYARKAKELNIVPCQLQAIIWMAYRENVRNLATQKGH